MACVCVFRASNQTSFIRIFQKFLASGNIGQVLKSHVGGKWEVWHWGGVKVLAERLSV